jgi:hypothetical protein
LPTCALDFAGHNQLQHPLARTLPFFCALRRSNQFVPPQNCNIADSCGNSKFNLLWLLTDKLTSETMCPCAARRREKGETEMTISKIEKAAAVQRLIARENTDDCCELPTDGTSAESLALLAALEERWAAGKPARFTRAEVDAESMEF